MISKQHLIDINLVIDNMYADLYLQLIQENIKTVKVKNSTQKHHIIPKYYFIYNNLLIDDSEENTVNLYFKDHILAHYYLSLCSPSDYFKFANISALKYLLGVNKELLNNDKLIKNLDNLQYLYEYYSSKRAVFVDLSGVNEGKVWMNNNINSVRVPPEDIDYYLSIGYIFGSNINTNKDKIVINNGTETKFITKNELETFLNQGWNKGFAKRYYTEEGRSNLVKKSSAKAKDTVAINNGKVSKYIKKSKLQEYLDNNWTKGLIIKNPNKKRLPHNYSKEERLKLSDLHSDTVWMHKKEHNIKIKKVKVSEYEQQGYILGRYIKDKSIFSSNLGHRWINKDGVNKSILEKDIPLYLAQGYKLGRDMSQVSIKKKKAYISGNNHANTGGKYLYKDGIKKHFHGQEIQDKLDQGWVTYEQQRKNF